MKLLDYAWHKMKFQPLEDPERPLFCQNTANSCLISGGWLLVSNVIVINGSSPFQLSLETSYRGISSYDNNKTFLTDNAMLELRTHLSFTQIRFHCSKQGRTFHVTTVTNSSGEAVVQYFSGQTDVQPDACGSFVRMNDDDSLMARRCHEWGVDGWTLNNVFKIGKWGPSYHSQLRLSDHPAFVVGLSHWLLSQDGSRLECDDNNPEISSGDFWKVFVR